MWEKHCGNMNGRVERSRKEEWDWKFRVGADMKGIYLVIEFLFDYVCQLDQKSFEFEISTYLLNKPSSALNGLTESSFMKGSGR